MQTIFEKGEREREIAGEKEGRRKIHIHIETEREGLREKIKQCKIIQCDQRTFRS